AEVTSGPDRTRGMGLIGAAFALGMVVGPAIGGSLSLLGPRVPYVFAAALCLLNLVMAAYRVPETLPAAARRVGGFRHPLARSSPRGPSCSRSVSGGSPSPGLRVSCSRRWAW